MYWILLRLFNVAIRMADVCGYYVITCDTEGNPVAGINLHLWSKKGLA